MTKPKPLPLFDMTPLELNGFLFVQFPTEWTLERSRDVLETLIRRCGFTQIDHSTVYIAMYAERARIAASLPAEVRRKRIEAAWAKRGAGRPAPAAPAKVNPDEWSF